MSRRRKGDPGGLIVIALLIIVFTAIGYYYWLKRLIDSALDIKLKVSIILFQLINVALILTGLYAKDGNPPDTEFWAMSFQLSIASLIAFIPSLGLQWALERLQPTLRRWDLV